MERSKGRPEPRDRDDDGDDFVTCEEVTKSLTREEGRGRGMVKSRGGEKMMPSWARLVLQGCRVDQ